MGRWDGLEGHGNPRAGPERDEGLGCDAVPRHKLETKAGDQGREDQLALHDGEGLTDALAASGEEGNIGEPLKFRVLKIFYL